MTTDQFVSGTTGALAPFLTQLVRDRMIRVDRHWALLLAVVISVIVTAGGYWLTSPTHTLDGFLVNAGLCFASSQAVYNGLSKGVISGVMSPGALAPNFPGGQQMPTGGPGEAGTGAEAADAGEPDTLTPADPKQ